MEEETTPSPEYIKGFNEGYALSEGLPDLAKELSKIESTSDRISGFKDGKKQYVLDKLHEQRDKVLNKSWDKKITEPERGKDRRDHDDRSLDKEI